MRNASPRPSIARPSASPSPAAAGVTRRATCALLGVATVLCAASGVRAQSPSSHRHHFKDADHWAKVFDDPKRDAWQRPHEVIQALALPPDAVVADIGAGTGYFALRLSHMLPQGRVYAVDAEPAMARHLAERAKREQRGNLTAIVASPDDPKLPAPIDLALLVNVYHHIGTGVAYFRRLHGSLKPNGRVAILDFTPDSPDGPPRSARVPAEQVIAEMKQAGYRVLREHRFLPQQFFIEFEAAR